MENVEKRIEKYKTIEKKYMYLVKILQELNYKDNCFKLSYKKFKKETSLADRIKKAV